MKEPGEMTVEEAAEHWDVGDFGLLEQDVWWIAGDGRVMRIEHMHWSHQMNLLNLLERKSVDIATYMWHEWMRFGSMLRGDMAIEQAEREEMRWWEASLDPKKAWYQIQGLPLTQRLQKEVDKIPAWKKALLPARNRAWELAHGKL